MPGRKKVRRTAADPRRFGALRFGLCCKFLDEPIKFRTTTARALLAKPRAEQLERLVGLCRDNARALQHALEYCAANGIGAFRINSQILPLKTHPQAGYSMAELPGGKQVVADFRRCGHYAAAQGLRLSLHPDQFILLSSEDEGVTRRSIEELEYHAEFAGWVGADVINIHGGGAYGNKGAALERVVKRIRSLKKAVRSRLTLENDDRVYTPEDLLPVCQAAGVPLVYDVHHHRCLPDALTVEDATERAMATWNREPLFHISSPREGWGSRTPQYHHDYIDLRDFPGCWLGMNLTVEVEAKAKEKAVERLIQKMGASLGKPSLRKK
jgi:UV DNA damage endonuclease